MIAPSHAESSTEPVMDSADESSGISRFLVRKPWVVVIAVLVLWGIFGWVPYFRGVRGEFGDVFGAVNALFSGLAFAMIILTILLQKQELTLQRQELTLTHEELKGQKEQLAIQNVTLARQMTENTFFALLRLHHETVNLLRLGPPFASKGAIGVECFESFGASFSGQFLIRQIHRKGNATKRSNQDGEAFTEGISNTSATILKTCTKFSGLSTRASRMNRDSSRTSSVHSYRPMRSSCSFI